MEERLKEECKDRRGGGRKQVLQGCIKMDDIWHSLRMKSSQR